MSVKQWLTDIGAAAEDLGYGIVSIEPGHIELVPHQGAGRVTIESPLLSGDLLRQRLLKIEHRSGSPYNDDYQRRAIR